MEPAPSEESPFFSEPRNREAFFAQLRAMPPLYSDEHLQQINDGARFIQVLTKATQLIKQQDYCAFSEYAESQIEFLRPNGRLFHLIEMLGDARRYPEMMRLLDFASHNEIRIEEHAKENLYWRLHCRHDIPEAELKSTRSLLALYKGICCAHYASDCAAPKIFAEMLEQGGAEAEAALGAYLARIVAAGAGPFAQQTWATMLGAFDSATERLAFASHLPDASCPSPSTRTL